MYVCTVCSYYLLLVSLVCMYVRHVQTIVTDRRQARTACPLARDKRQEEAKRGSHGMAWVADSTTLHASKHTCNNRTGTDSNVHDNATRLLQT